MLWPSVSPHETHKEPDPERVALAASLRDFIETLMTTSDLASSTIAEAAGTINELNKTLQTAGSSGFPRAQGHEYYIERSPAVGITSPIAPGPIEWSVEDDIDHPGYKRCIAVNRIGGQYEGPPTFVHGGIIALIFDEVLGIVNVINGCFGMTGTLSIKYRRPTPLGQELRWISHIEHVEGRRTTSKAALFNGEQLLAEATGLFVRPTEATAQAYFGV